MKDPIINLRDVARDRMAHGEKFEATIGRVGSALGARELGCSLVEVPPGKRACPFHTHHNIHEMFIILQGTATLRLGAETRPLKQGDVISTRAGGQPHQIVNTGEHLLQYLAISTIRETDVVDYPDSNKVGIAVGSGVSGPPRMHFIRDGKDAAYWDGEE